MSSSTQHHTRRPSQAEIDTPMTGELRKRSAHLGLYRRRNVVLSALGMQIYELGEVEKPISIVPLTADTCVSDITMDTVRGNHGVAHPNQAIFRVIPNENLNTSLTSSTHSYRPRVFGSSTEEHWFSAPTKEIAQQWKKAIEDRAASLASARGVRASSSRAESLDNSSSTAATEKVTDNPAGGGAQAEGAKTMAATESMLTIRDEKARVLRERMRRTASMHIRSLPRPVHTTINLIQQAQWREVLVTNGLRIMAEVALAKENPCLRVSCVLPASVDRAFALMYDFDRRSLWDSMTESVEMIKEEDDGHLRTIHCKLRSQKVGGLWMAPRDYIVDSSWRKDDDGSIVLIETSSKDNNIPEVKGYVRAEIYALGITLCPRRRGPVKSKHSRREVTLTPESETEENTSCLLQMAVHANVGGWLSKMPLEWGQHWLYNFMLRVVGFRSVLEEENYELVDFQSLTSSASRAAAAAAAAGGREESQPKTEDERLDEEETARGIAIAASPRAGAQKEQLPQVEGTLPTANVYNITEPFNLRSKTYLDDKRKEPSQGTMFDLIAMDLWEVDEPIDNVAVNMKGGLAYKYLNAPGPKPYLFIVQFQVPGPPFLSFVAYFAAKPGAIETVSPFSRLFADFVDGTDAFRDSRFKFIPRVVKGSCEFIFRSRSRR